MDCVEVMREKPGEELARLYNELTYVQPSTEEYANILDAIKELSTLSMELIKIDANYEDMSEKRRIDEEDRIERREMDKKRIRQQIVELWSNHGKDILELVAKIGFFSFWCITGFKFEETNSISSFFFKHIWSKFGLFK